MIDPMELRQTQLGCGGLQIGTQTITEENHYHTGLSSEEASKIAINLFLDNFPKLQQLAKEIAEERVNELCNKIISALESENIIDYSAFSDPDVQYVLFKAQKDYARFGTEELLNNLSDLVVKRIKYNEDMYLKIVIDKAISVVGNLSKEQIDALTLLFYYKSAQFRSIKSIEDLKKRFESSVQMFSPCGKEGYSLLNALGCIELDIGYSVERCADTYHLNKNEVETICPETIKQLSPDYAPSHIGVMIAIINSYRKAKYIFDPKIWIHY